MNTLELVGTALRSMGLAEPLPSMPTEAVCCITGERGPCIERRLLIGESFTTQGGFMAPDSEYVSVHAWAAFKHRPERAGNWYCDGREFVTMNREEARARIKHSISLLSPAPWAMYVTTSFKKHGSVVAPCNQGSMRIAFEMQVVDLWATPYKAFDTDLLYWQAHGIARADLQSGYLHKTTNAEPDAVANFLALAPARRHSASYRLMAYLLPGKEAEAEAPDVD